MGGLTPRGPQAERKLMAPHRWFVPGVRAGQVEPTRLPKESRNQSIRTHSLRPDPRTHAWRIRSAVFNAPKRSGSFSLTLARSDQRNRSSLKSPTPGTPAKHGPKPKGPKGLWATEPGMEPSLFCAQGFAKSEEVASDSLVGEDSETCNDVSLERETKGQSKGAN